MTDRGQPTPNFKRKHNRPGDILNNLFRNKGLVIAPGVYDAMGAQIAGQIYARRADTGQPCTFNAVYGSGWAISAMLWCLPDMGFHTLDMMKLIGGHIVKQAYPLPVILDAETGFGNYVTLTQTVEAYHELGVALAHLEDQEGVRRCGNLGGKSCVSEQDMQAKIRSWLKTSEELGSTMQLMVRTDALTAAGGGIENAIERGKRYMDTDYNGRRPLVLWADAMIGRATIDRWINEFRKFNPDIILGFNYSPNKDWMTHYYNESGSLPPTYNELYGDGSGFQLIFHTILQARADMESTWNTFDDMASNGAASLWNLHERQRKHPVGDAQAMSNIRPWQAYEKEIGGEEAVRRYESSQGYKSENK